MEHPVRSWTKATPTLRSKMKYIHNNRDEHFSVSNFYLRLDLKTWPLKILSNITNPFYSSSNEQNFDIILIIQFRDAIKLSAIVNDKSF